MIASQDRTKLYVTVGSNSNVGERGMANEERRAEILEVDRASQAQRGVFASGLRNPNGLDLNPPSPARSGPQSTSATSSAATWSRTT